jgi:predicted GNAT family acetyltransferase
MVFNDSSHDGMAQMLTCYYEIIGHQLCVLDLSPNLLGEGMVINRVNVPERFRGQGFGRKVMAACLHDADIEGVTLSLDINPYGRMTRSELESWYLRCGFVKMHDGRPGVIGNSSHQYRRLPLGVAAPLQLR